MKNIFDTRPAKRSFNYKPRFQKAESANENYPFNLEKFGEKLHSSWQQKRDRREKGHSSIKNVIWFIFIIIILLCIAYKFLF